MSFKYGLSKYAFLIFFTVSVFPSIPWIVVSLIFDASLPVQVNTFVLNTCCQPVCAIQVIPSGIPFLVSHIPHGLFLPDVGLFLKIYV